MQSDSVAKLWRSKASATRSLQLIKKRRVCIRSPNVCSQQSDPLLWSRSVPSASATRRSGLKIQQLQQLRLRVKSTKAIRTSRGWKSRSEDRALIASELPLGESWAAAADPGIQQLSLQLNSPAWRHEERNTVLHRVAFSDANDVH